MNIVILDSGYKSYAFEKELFEGYGFQLKIHPLFKGETTEKINFAKDADGILVRHTIIDEEFLFAMKNLKAVVRYGVGYDNVDVEACTRFGVKVANVQGYASHSVSDHALALMLSCSRALWNTRKQLTQKFGAPPVEDIFELHDKILGIIGLGRIGSTLSQKAAPLFQKIVGYDPYKSPHYFNRFPVQKVGMEELLEKSDIISLHCNLTEETTHLIGKTALSKMKKKPVIINTSRGETIDGKALLEALNMEEGLPVRNSRNINAQQKLIKHSRTICTGHYAWYSDQAALELQKRAAQNLLDLLHNKQVDDQLN